MLLQRLVNSYGEAMTASYTVACRLECYLLVTVGAFTSAMATYAGQNLGAGDYKRIRLGLRQTTIMAFCIAMITGMIGYVLAPMLVRSFALEGDSIRYCLSHVRLVCYICLSIILCFVTNNNFGDGISIL